MPKLHTPEHYMFLDLETTGLDPDQGYILEAAFVLTDRHFNHVDQLTCVLKIPRDFVELGFVDPFVVAMHNNNGLWEDCYKQTHTEHEVIECVATWLNMLGIDLKEVPLAGSTIGFDRAWVRHHWPEVEKMFSHRSFDVSTLKMLFRNVGLDTDEPKSRELHRAYPDIIDSIEVAKFYRNLLDPS